MNNGWLLNYLKVKKDSLWYSKKNRSNAKTILWVVIFIIIAFLISLIILSSLGYSFTRSIEHIFTVPFTKSISKDFAVQIATYGMASLAFLFAYKTGLFNIGVTGQMMGAGLAIVGAGQALSQDGNIAVGQGAVVLTLIVAILTGAFIALISGVLKTLFNIHEVVSGIMLNWIIFFLAKYLMSSGGDLYNDGLISAVIPENMSIYDSTVSSSFVGAIIIFLVCTIFVWFLLKFTVFGKKIKSVGLSKDASTYSGYNAKSLQLSSFAISGAIAGLLAVIVYAGSGDRAIPFPQIDNLPQYGFDGIAISLISFSNPIALIPVSIFLSIIKTGSVAAAPFPNSFGDLLLGIVMYGVAIFVLVYRYKPISWIKKKLSKKEQYKNNFYITSYTETTKNYSNKIEKLLSDRKVELFLKNIGVKNNVAKSLPNLKNLVWYTSKKLLIVETISEKIKNMNEVNIKYLNEKAKLKKEKVGFFASFSMTNDKYKSINSQETKGGTK